jgi:hypothetical protein
MKESLDDLRVHLKEFVVCKKRIPDSKEGILALGVLCKPTVAHTLGFNGGEHFRECYRTLNEQGVSTPGAYVHYCIENANDPIYQKMRAAGRVL